MSSSTDAGVLVFAGGQMARTGQSRIMAAYLDAQSRPGRAVSELQRGWLDACHVRLYVKGCAGDRLIAFCIMRGSS